MEKIRVLNMRLRSCLDCPYHIHHQRDFSVEVSGLVTAIPAGHYCLRANLENGEMRRIFLDRDINALPQEVRTFNDALKTIYGGTFPTFCPLPERDVQVTVKGRRNLELK